MQKLALPTSNEELWNCISLKLQNKLQNEENQFQSIDEFITFNKQLLNEISNNFISLELDYSYHFHNILFLFKKKHTDIDLNYFLKTTLNKMMRWILEMPELFISNEITILSIGQPSKIKFTKRQIRCLLSTAFFSLLFKPSLQQNKNLTHLDFGLFKSVASPTFLKSIINYFNKISKYTYFELDELYVILERKVLQNNLSTIKQEKHFCEIDFVEGKLQDNLNHLFVDFANRKVGGHVLEGAVAQEEIMFAEMPELFISILICEHLNDNETLLIKGIDRFSNCKGYLHSMTFEDYKETQPIKDGIRKNEVIAMDALAGIGQAQFEKQYLLREVKKAYCGFMKVDDNDEHLPIASGFWGCGVFGGDKQLKIILQWIAASLADRPKLMIHLFSPDDLRIAKEFKENILPKVQGLKHVEKICDLLFELYPQARREQSTTVFEFLRNNL
ncbi:hypothetical protein ABK040_004110 [Willaertia magna]